MGFPLFFIFVSILVLASIIVIKTIYYKSKITHVNGMMISMSLGMSVGLTLGIIFGIQLTGNLFLSSILGMMAGITAGVLSGLAISVMAVLDGLLSGLMGGMMGAMLGEMIVPGYYNSIVKIMFILFLSSILLLLFMFQREIKEEDTFFFDNPLVLIAIFGLVFLLLNQTGPLFKVDRPYEEQKEHIGYHNIK